jgi:hypothetical protein
MAYAALSESRRDEARTEMVSPAAAVAELDQLLDAPFRTLSRAEAEIRRAVGVRGY